MNKKDGQRGEEREEKHPALIISPSHLPLTTQLNSTELCRACVRACLEHHTRSVRQPPADIILPPHQRPALPAVVIRPELQSSTPLSLSLSVREEEGRARIIITPRRADSAENPKAHHPRVPFYHSADTPPKSGKRRRHHRRVTVPCSASASMFDDCESSNGAYPSVSIRPSRAASAQT